MSLDLTRHHSTHSYGHTHTVIHTTVHHYHSGLTGYRHTTTYTHGGGLGAGWIVALVILAAVVLVISKVRSSN